MASGTGRDPAQAPTRASLRSPTRSGQLTAYQLELPAEEAKSREGYFGVKKIGMTVGNLRSP